MATLRTAVLTIIVILSGCSVPADSTGSAEPELGAALAAGRLPVATGSATIRIGWPSKDIRAGLAPSGQIGLRARRPLNRETRPRCALTKAQAVTIARKKPDQVLLTTAGGTRARVVGCVRTAGGVYRQTLGPFPARVGRNGVAPPGAKREGDGRTPGGVFRLGTGFGSDGNPGLGKHFGWIDTKRADVWVDDPKSGLYNTRQRVPARGRWRSAERLRIPPYRNAQVIDYNPGRIPGRGSAIFLHIGTGGPTAGCVSLRASDLKAVLRWESPGALIAIS